MNRLITIIAFTLISLSTFAYQVSGVVTDSLTHNSIPFASVKMIKAGWGKLTNEQGSFQIDEAQIGDTLLVTAMGYSTQKVPITSKRHKYNISISPIGVRLKEVIIKPRKEKYSKKNNPAVDFVNKIRNSSQSTNPRRNDYYNYDKYERITIALNNIDPNSKKNLILRKFDFLRDYVDTSEVSGRPILTLSVREKRSSNHYRKTPLTEKEDIIAVNQTGVDDFLDEETSRVLYEDLLGDIDLYKNNIYLIRNQFVSPLSSIAPDFYKFYLSDTVAVEGEQCAVLSFVPHNSQTFGFVGKIYVPLADTTMFIKKVEMSVPKDINLNFIEKIYINQEYKKAPDGSRLLVRDDLITEASILPGTQGLYFRRNTAYENHDFTPYSDLKLFSMLGRTRLDLNAQYRDTTYWNKHRLIEFKPKENKVAEITEKLRKIPLYRWIEKILKIVTTEYISTGKDSKFDFGPINTTFSHNTVEGYRLRVGGMTTGNLSKRWFAQGYAAYGFHDKKEKYGADLEYSFIDKKYYSGEFPIHAIRLSHRYDIDMIGRHYAFTNADNFVLSIQRHPNYLANYLRTTKLEYILELQNNFSIDATLFHKRHEISPYMGYVNGYGESFNHYNESGFKISLRYAPGEKFYQRNIDRININKSVLVFQLSHTLVPKGFAGNPFNINVTEASMRKRIWISAFGYVDALVKAGHLWSSAPYPNLLIPNANMSYTIQPESFSLLNPMEFITDSYAEWHFTYFANGTIFNYIPFFRKLKLREVFSFRGVFGHLSKDNNPEYNPQLYRIPELVKTYPMTAKPYMEAGVGVDNIFKMFRLEYVWRLSYLDLPNADKGGLRVAFHLSF